MNIQPNILFTVHRGCSFRRWSCRRLQPTPQGAPSIMRLRHLSLGRDVLIESKHDCKLLDIKSPRQDRLPEQDWCRVEKQMIYDLISLGPKIAAGGPF